MEYVIAWARAFAFTALIEVVIAALLFTRVLGVAMGEGGGAPVGGRAPARWLSVARLAAILFYANLASHPAVWFVFPKLGSSFSMMVLTAEVWAVASEAIFYWLVIPNVRLGQAAGVSLVANGSSFGIGLLVRAWTGWV